MDTKIKRISGLTAVPIHPGTSLISDPFVKLRGFSGSLWAPVTDSKWSHRSMPFILRQKRKVVRPGIFLCVILAHYFYKPSTANTKAHCK